MAGCVFAQQLQSYGSEMQIGGISNGFAAGVGADSKTDKLTGYGCTCNGNVLVGLGSFAGVFGLYTATAANFQVGTAGHDYAFLNGCRFDGGTFISNVARVEGNGTCLNLFNKTVSVALCSSLIMNAGTWTFAVAAGECVLAKTSATVVINFATVTGGTTDAASFGMRAISGAKIILVNKAPTLTGVAGADMKAESTAAIANATLSANGQSTLDAVTQAIIMRVAA
jgi:hypothetical protein